MGNEILSASYIIIDVLLLIGVVLGAVFNWVLAVVCAVMFFLYPIPYEAILKCIFAILFKIQRTKEQDPQAYQYMDDGNFIVYDPVYDLKACGLEKKHPFDACKYERTMRFLNEYDPKGNWNNYNKTNPPNYSFIYNYTGLLHLILLNYSIYLSKIAELAVCFIPSSVLRLMLLRRLYYAAQGSIDASELALKKGFAINLGGGFHHAHFTGGSGFCFLNDIGLVVKHLRLYHKQLKNIMIIDLDAHQGNGHARDKMHLRDPNLYIFDAYNKNIFPFDEKAKKAIDKAYTVNRNTNDREYCDQIKQKMKEIDEEFKADFIIYNAGTDILEGDKLGGLSITEQGIIERDEIVVEYALNNKIPIMMVLSGGYQYSNAPLIARSIIHINETFNLK